MNIEFANLNDIPELIKLLSILFSQEKEFSPDHQAQLTGLTLIINNPQIGHIIVARQNDKITGMLNLLYTISTALGKKVCILEDMVVEPNSRKLKIGTKLIEFAISHAKNTGCSRITLLTDKSNILAQNFYKRFGFQISSMIPLRLSLDENN